MKLRVMDLMDFHTAVLSCVTLLHRKSLFLHQEYYLDFSVFRGMLASRILQLVVGVALSCDQ